MKEKWVVFFCYVEIWDILLDLLIGSWLFKYEVYERSLGWKDRCKSFWYVGGWNCGVMYFILGEVVCMIDIW